MSLQQGYCLYKDIQPECKISNANFFVQGTIAQIVALKDLNYNDF